MIYSCLIELVIICFRGIFSPTKMDLVSNILLVEECFHLKFSLIKIEAIAFVINLLVL